MTTGLSAKTLWRVYRQVNARRWGLMRNEQILPMGRLDHYAKLSNKLSAALTAKLDEQQAEVETLRAENERLRQHIAALERHLQGTRGAVLRVTDEFRAYREEHGEGKEG